MMKQLFSIENLWGTIVLLGFLGSIYVTVLTACAYLEACHVQ